MPGSHPAAADRRDLHGLVVEARCAAGVDPAALLLGLLPPAAPGAAPGLAIDTAVAAHPGELEPAGAIAFAVPGVELRLTADGATVFGHGGAVALLAARLRVRTRAPLDAPGAQALAQVPLLLALLAALRPLGLHHLHAGTAVAPDGRALLVAGDSGSGKSTLTAALVRAGCGYLGDDVVLLGAGPRLLAFPRAFHLSDRAAEAIGGPPRPPDERRTPLGKRALDPGVLFPGQGRHEAPAPAALLFPHVVDRADTVLRALSGAEALGRLLESSALVAVKALPGTREHLALLGAIVDGARAFEVELGRDLLLDAARSAGRVLQAALRG